MDLLSTGVLPKLVAGAKPDGPVLQIAQLREIPGAGTTRYRMLVSDGVNQSSFAMLATQLNSLVSEDSVAQFAIIRLDRYCINEVNGNRKVLIVLGLSVLKTAAEVGEIVGDPKSYDPSKAPPPSAVESPQPKTISTMNAVPSPRTPLAKRNLPNSINQPMNSPGGSPLNVQPIAALTPYSNKWTIRARVTTKSDIRTWSNSRGEGKLFSFNLLDESGEIKATAFKDQCDMFFDLVQVDKVYYISSAVLKAANKQYSKVNNDYEITFNQSTTVIPCTEETAIPAMQFDFVTIDQIDKIEKDNHIDVIGVVASHGDIQAITAKSGNEFKKRDLQIVDQTGHQINLTLWGSQAESFDGSSMPVLAAKTVKVSDFNGKSLSASFSSIIQINPDIPIAHKLKGWFESGGAQDVVNLSANRMGGGDGVRGALKTFKEADIEGLGKSGNVDFYSNSGFVSLIKKDNCLYEACPSEACNKKVVDMNNGLYRCEKCSKEYDSFKYRLLLQVNISDVTEDRWVTLFQDTAEKILGVTAQELGSMKDADGDSFSDLFSNAAFKEYMFSLRVKMDTYNDENRLKTSVSNIEKVDAKKQCKVLIENINKLLMQAN